MLVIRRDGWMDGWRTRGGVADGELASVGGGTMEADNYLDVDCGRCDDGGKQAKGKQGQLALLGTGTGSVDVSGRTAGLECRMKQKGNYPVEGMMCLDGWMGELSCAWRDEALTLPN